jgi:hypothetical protein
MLYVRLIRALTWGFGVLLTLACTATPTQAMTGHPAVDCDRAALVADAARNLGEHQASLRLVGPAEMEELSGDATNYGVADTETVAFLTTMECRYVAATVAHELTHVWQARSIGEGDIYAAFGHDHAEAVADCGAALTGWEDYAPYLTKRGYGCTGQELQEAKQFRGWAK